MRDRVLIVEDDADIRFGTVRQLRSLDAVILEAGSAEEAFGALRTAPVDVVLLDLSLPDARGTDAISEVRRLAPEVHLIVVTGSADDALRSRCFAAGADDFVTKPFNMGALTSQVGAALRRPASDGP